MIALHQRLSEICNFDLNQLMNLDGKLNGSPFLLYMKDLKGKYLHANEPELELFGFQNESEMTGQTDLDLCMTTEEALKVRNTDTKIIRSEKPVSLVESATVADGTIMAGVSLKAPLRLKTNKIIGIMGVTFVFQRKNRAEVNSGKSYLPLLTKRENECLNYLGEGLSYKNIADKMSVSYRTVEHHLEAAKSKLNCKSRTELIRYLYENYQF